MDDVTDAPEDDAPNELKAQQSVGVPPPSPTAHTNFPIEGESDWTGTMRMLVSVTIVVLLLIALVTKFLAPDGSFIEGQQLLFVCGGIVFVLMAEYFIFLKIVIPRQANYARYVINRDEVLYYPLGTLGINVSTKPTRERIGKFMGVTTGKVKSKKGGTRYAVYLLHKTEKGKTINVNDFSSMQDASQFATDLARDLGLAVALR